MNNKEQRYTALYMDIAKRVAEMSYAKRLQVGSVIVKDGNIISFGWNGTPSGWDNSCENFIGHGIDGEPVLKTRPEVIHAESNAITKLAKSNNGGNNADMFITHGPCIECSKLILQSGIKRVFYGAQYRDDSGINFLQKSGVEVKRV